MWTPEMVPRVSGLERFHILVKPPPIGAYTRNTQDSSDINPGALPSGFMSELSHVLLINTDGGWFDWLVPLQAYKLLLCFSPLPCSPNQTSPSMGFMSVPKSKLGMLHCIIQNL